MIINSFSVTETGCGILINIIDTSVIVCNVVDIIITIIISMVGVYVHDL